MFGYIKVKREELLVKDFMLYKAVYCGLCKRIKKISFFIPFSLSYDFVFLAIVRDILEGNSFTVENGRCPYNPFKKKAFVTSRGIDYSALASLVLIEGNVADKLSDKDSKLLYPFLKIADLYLKRKIKKHYKSDELCDMAKRVRDGLSRFSELEKAHAISDELGAAFGIVLGEVISSGLEEAPARIGRAVGEAVGGWLYLADAVDDCEKDFKKHQFNPLLEEYKTPDEVRLHLRDIDVTFASLARDAHLALSLVSQGELGRITDNILSEGLGQVAYDIMNDKRRKK